MSSNPITSVQMGAIRMQPLVRSKSQAETAERPNRLIRADKAMTAANLGNGVPNRGGVVRSICAVSGQTHNINAAHILPHSYWSTARQHEWLFYAKVIPNGTSAELAELKVTEKNLLWLRVAWASMMEPTKCQVVVVPELSELMEQAKEILNNIPSNSPDTFRNFSALDLLKKWTQQITIEHQDPVKVYPYSIWFMKPDPDPLEPPPDETEFVLSWQGERKIHAAILDTFENVPISYTPPLPTCWKWCLCPIITSLVAWKTLSEPPAFLTDTPEAINKKKELDDFLRLCESETPSSWRITGYQDPSAALDSNPDLRQRDFRGTDGELWQSPPRRAIRSNLQLPSALNPPSTPSDRNRKRKPNNVPATVNSRRCLDKIGQGERQDSTADADRHLGSNGQQELMDDAGDRDPANISTETEQEFHKLFEDSEADTSFKTELTSPRSGKRLSHRWSQRSLMPYQEQEEKMSLQERFDELQMRMQDNGDAKDLVEKMKEAEEKTIRKARLLIRETFEKKAGELGPGQAMRWLRSGKRDPVDDEVDKLKREWMVLALELELEFIRQSERRDGSNVLDWQRKVCGVSDGLGSLSMSPCQDK